MSHSAWGNNLCCWYFFCSPVVITTLMEQKQETELYPIYIKAPAVLLTLVLSVFILYVLSSVFVPLAFAVLFAMLLNRLCVRLEGVMPKIPAIILTILIAILFLAVLFYFLSTQIAGFVNSLPLMKQNLQPCYMNCKTGQRTS